MEQLDFIRNAGETKRFHTWPVLRQQNVAEHSWHVAMLLWFIFGNDEPGLRMPLMMAALTHDAAEWKVGDLPSPGKRAMSEHFPDFREKWGEMEQGILKEYAWDWESLLEPWELAALKLVDSMDGALYCVRERTMGNKLIEPCYRNFISYVEETLMASFPVMVQHGDRRVTTTHDVPFPDTDVTPASTKIARDVYNHIQDMWNQADDS